MIVLVVGLTVVGVGVALIVLPGPAFIVIPIGLGILATEFAWARHLLHAARDRARSMVNGRATRPPANGNTNGDANAAPLDRIEVPPPPAVAVSFQPVTGTEPKTMPAPQPDDLPRL
jgi:tellurite resistance protein TerC